VSVCHVAGNGSLRMRVCQSLFIGRVWCLGVWMSQDVRVLREWIAVSCQGLDAVLPRYSGTVIGLTTWIC